MAYYEDTINTPRHRFDPSDTLPIPVPDEIHGGVVMNTIGVTIEYWKDWKGLADFVPHETWSAEKVERLKRSIYFSHLPNYVSFVDC